MPGGPGALLCPQQGPPRALTWDSASPPLHNPVPASPPLLSLPSSPLRPRGSFYSCSNPEVLSSSPGFFSNRQYWAMPMGSFLIPGSQFAHLYTGALSLKLGPHCLCGKCFWRPLPVETTDQGEQTLFFLLSCPCFRRSHICWA